MNTISPESALTRTPCTPPPCFNFKTSAWDEPAASRVMPAKNLMVLFIAICLLVLLNDGQAGEDLQVHEFFNLGLDLQPPGSVFWRKDLTEALEILLLKVQPPGLDVQHTHRDLRCGFLA